MLTLLLAYVLTWVLVQQAQTYLIAKELRPVNRSLKLLLLQTNLITFIYSLALLLSYRPFLAGLITLACCAIFLVVNQAKYKALAEPLVFSDIYLYLQVFTHPRLFLPFLNLPLTGLALLIGITLLYSAIWLEPSLELELPRIGFTIFVLACLPVLFISMSKQALAFKLNFEPATDIIKFGFFNSLAIYFIQASQKKNQDAFRVTIQTQANYTPRDQLPTEFPNLVVIQSESFFDPRNLSQSINPTVLQYFDDLKSTSIQNGKLTIPAWGANTLRSEYAFLSGIENKALKHYRFNPYQFIQNESSFSIVSYLKSLGYRCICIHPNHSIFFKRDKVFPLLGFDEFIDISEFDSTQKQGPYISDQALTAKIQQILNDKNNKQPLFIFAITMENHGPLHLENYLDSELVQLYRSEPPKQHHDLSIYLKHLKNADQMLLSLTEDFKTQVESTWLCWYGDHIPSMPAVYKELNWQDGRSEYLLWNNQQPTQRGLQKDLSIEQLGLELLSLAGLGVANKT